jgi:hypothetical protein
VAEDKAEEAVSIALMDLKLEGVIDESYGVTDDYEDSEKYKEIMGMNQGTSVEEDSQETNQEQETEVEDPVEPDSDSGDEDTEISEERDVEMEEDEPEAPGEEWVCPCGQLNEGDRAVCRNPKCLKPYEEVEEQSD